MEQIFSNTTLTVNQLIEKIDTGELGLPELQRPFIWKDSKVRDLFDSLMRETLDAAILLRMDIPQNQMNEIRSICIAPWRLCAAVSKKSPLAHKKSISIRDLDGMNLMTAWTEGISDFSPYIIRKFHLNGIEPRFTYFTHDMGELLMRAATGEGISLLTDAAVDRIVGDVSLVPIHDFNKEFEGVLCWKKKNQGIDFCDLANKLRQ